MFKNSLKIIVIGVLLSTSLLPAKLCSSMGYYASAVAKKTQLPNSFTSKSFLQRLSHPVIHPAHLVRKHLFITLGAAGLVTIGVVGHFTGLFSRRNGKSLNKVMQNPSAQQGSAMKHSFLYSIVLWCNVIMPGVMEDLSRVFEAMLWPQSTQLSTTAKESTQPIKQIVDPKQAEADWGKIDTYLLKMKSPKEGESLYGMVKDIFENEKRLYAALLKNPNSTVVSDVLWMYKFYDLYEIPEQEEDNFKKTLITFVKGVDKKNLEKDSGLLRALHSCSDRSLVRFFYEKLGKETFGKIVIESAKKDDKLVDSFVVDTSKPSQLDDFYGYWNSLIIDSNMDFFVEKEKGENNFSSINILFRGAPSELIESMKTFLGKCIEQSCNMDFILDFAIKGGYYDIVKFLIEKKPELIKNFESEENVLIQLISLHLEDSRGDSPTQSVINKNIESLNSALEYIVEKEQPKLKNELGDVSKHLKTVTAVSIKKAQEAFHKVYPHVDSGGTQAVVGVNDGLYKLLDLVQLREDTKDIIVLLQKKANEKKIKIKVKPSLATDEQLEKVGFKDVIDGTYVSKHEMSSGLPKS